jgi:hypothetical protein
VLMRPAQGPDRAFSPETSIAPFAIVIVAGRLGCESWVIVTVGP